MVEGEGVYFAVRLMGRVSDLSQFQDVQFLSHHFSLDLYGGHCFESLCASSSSDVEPIISCNKNFYKI